MIPEESPFLRHGLFVFESIVRDSILETGVVQWPIWNRRRFMVKGSEGSIRVKSIDHKVALSGCNRHVSTHKL